MTTSRGNAASGFARYGTAIAAATAAVLTAAAWPLGSPAPMAFSLAAVMLAGWVGGAGPSLLAAGLSIVAAVADFPSWPGSAGFRRDAAGDVATFAVVSAFIAACSGARLAAEARGRAPREPERSGPRPPEPGADRATPTPTPDGRVLAIDEADPRAGEEKYRALFNSIDEGFCIIEMIHDDAGRPVDYRFLEANPAFITHTGLVDAPGRTMREMVPEHDDSWFEIYGEVVATGAPIRFINHASKMDGRWFDLYAFPVGGPRVAVLFKNVTAAVEAERERERLLLTLRHERARLETFLKEAPAFICILRGPDHVFELANRRYYDLVGDRAIIGRPVREAFPELEGQGFFEHLDEVYRTGEPYVGEERPAVLSRPVGGVARRFVNVVYQATREPDGSISGVFVHGFDVTDLVASREALRESEASFRHLADSMPQAVWSARPDGSIDYCNRRWERYGGCPGGVLGDEGWAGLIHPDDLELARDAWRESILTGGPFEVEYRLRLAHGGYRWHLGRALPIEDARGEIARWFGANTDVDDVKRLSEALKQADRRKDEFLATLAHELRNPLAPLRNGLQILGLDPSREVLDMTMEMMGRQLGHMVRLVDDLMDVARVGSGKITLRRERTTLQAAAIGAIESTRDVVDLGRHELSVSMPDEPLILDADPTRLTQILSNLLTNAAKYTRKGGRIALTVRREGDEAVATVKDSGVGLAPEMLSRVFDMFTQVDASVMHSQGGLGIGLTIVKRLVELHRGRIEARSEGEGKGSEFIVRFPLAHPADDEAPIPRADGPGVSTGPIRVLVVDDNRDSANTLSRLLELDGHEVHTSYNGADALAAAAASPPDAILLDLGLPDKNGYEIAEEMRARPELADAMIVALTGWGQPEDRRRSREAGFDHHMVKPVDMRALRNILAVVAAAVRERNDRAPAGREA
ncbi:ATP-binding protein [Paludisphaera sp.]|uniref:ATP-binding protein n=1 Tax=Paludisphaera sp. TaxID=2017432 RepID=UPI00301C0DA5